MKNSRNILKNHTWLWIMSLAVCSIFQSCEEGVEMQDICDCELNYAPICADGTMYANPCLAVCNGANPLDFEACPSSSIDSTGVVPCMITFDFNPVCAGGITYGNASEAVCAGFSTWELGPCETAECICPLNYDPVCVATPSGTILSFSNACFAACEGYEGIYYPCNPDELIKCPNGIYGQVVDFTGLDGCGLVIETPMFGTLEPALVSTGDTLVAGMNITFEFEYIDGMSICMVGPIIEITCLDYN